MCETSRELTSSFSLYILIRGRPITLYFLSCLSSFPLLGLYFISCLSSPLLCLYFICLWSFTEFISKICIQHNQRPFINVKGGCHGENVIGGNVQGGGGGGPRGEMSVRKRPGVNVRRQMSRGDVPGGGGMSGGVCVCLGRGRIVPGGNVLGWNVWGEGGRISSVLESSRIKKCPYIACGLTETEQQESETHYLISIQNVQKKGIGAFSLQQYNKGQDVPCLSFILYQRFFLRKQQWLNNVFWIFWIF